MNGSVSNLHAFASTSKLKTLAYHPNEETTIIKDKYSFENLKLSKGAIVAVAEYDSETNQNGCILRIKCEHSTLQDDTKITVNGKDINVVKIYLLFFITWICIHFPNFHLHLIVFALN